MPAASLLSIFILIPLRPAPVSLSRPQSAGHLSFSNMFYLFSFFFSAACSAPHSAGGVVFQISSLVVLWTSLHFLIFLLTREQQLPPASVLTWCSKYSCQLEFRPDRWHAKSERTTNLLTSSPLWGQRPLPKLYWWKLPCCSPTCG